MNLRRTYLVIAILSFCVPALMIFRAMGEVNWDFSVAFADLSEFARSIFGQVVLTGYFLSGLSLTFFIFYEAHARSDYYLYWAFLPLLFVGIGVALPFYLYLRMPKQE